MGLSGLQQIFFQYGGTNMNELRARVISQEKGLYKIQSGTAVKLAEISGKYRYETQTVSDYPAVGDYVIAAWPEDDSNAVITGLFPRRSCFIRKAAGAGKQEQVVAANIDTAFLCMSLNNNFNIRRLERYLSVAYDSGAAPVVVLTKSDLCSDVECSMKTIGLIGGMSWESTVTYYQIINEIVKKELGGLHSAKCILYSVDFDEIERCQSTGAWEKSGEILGKAAESLEAAGADFILICTNTMHKVFEQVQRYVNIPFIHIAQATADVLKRENITRVGLLGTKYTMEQDFYKGKLAENGISVVIPDADDIETVNSIIFHELCVGKIEDESRKKYLEIIDKMSAKGVQGVILGCTEIGLLIHQEDTSVKLFDTTQIHGEAAAYMSLDRL